MYVAFKFSVNKLSWNQFLILQIAVFSQPWSLEFVKHLINSLVSSVNIIGMAVGSTALGRSLICILRKVKCPRCIPAVPLVLL
jgi:hypothetical protein